MTKSLTAKGRFNYGRKALRPGDPFDASDSDAKILVGINKASYATRVMVAEPVRQEAHQPARARRGRYKTATPISHSSPAAQAELATGDSPPVIEPTSLHGDDAQQVSNQYERRDMQADGE